MYACRTSLSSGDMLGVRGTSPFPAAVEFLMSLRYQATAQTCTAAGSVFTHGLGVEPVEWMFNGRGATDVGPFLVTSPTTQTITVGCKTNGNLVDVFASVPHSLIR